MLDRRTFTKGLLAAPAMLRASDSFQARRGTNISHWLSQSRRRGAERRSYFQKKDVAFLAGLGLDHLRIPVDEEQLWDESGEREPEAFELLNNALDWCDEYGLGAVIDLHILRSHHFNEKERPLWTKPEAQERFLDCWRDLSSQVGGRSVGKVAYEPMNEPVADDPEQWNRLVNKMVAVIRELEPKRKIIVGSNMWQSVFTFDELRIPENDPDVILSFHYYHPMILTHYRASWTRAGDYTGPVNYPGRLAPEAELESLEPGLKSALVPENRFVFDRSTTAELIEGPLAAARKYGLPLYSGEWGVIDKAPAGPRMRWYEDTRSVFEENGIGWATWDYKGGFGLFKDGRPVTSLIKALGLQPG